MKRISDPAARSTAIRRALLFLLVCAPLWLVPRVFSRLAHPTVPLAIVLGVTLLFLWWDGRPASELGLDPSWRRLVELVGGFGGGALLIGVIALCLRLLLPIPWVRNPSFSLATAGFSLVWLLVENGMEELVFRGYSFERLISVIGHWRAQLLTALLFAAFHIVNGWSWPVALVGTTIGSLLFGLVFVRWQSVPAAVGVHAAGNWVRDLLLLDPPNAKTLYAPFSLRRWTPHEQMTGGIVFNGLILLACVLLWWSVRRSGVLAPTAKSGRRA
jgi:membrane protease YdiL (CAAX protease family)